ncbi:methyl-accepting chemotaxis protein [Bradyrhizobium sp. USDA 4353]
MRHLTVYQRLAAIIAVMSIALFAVSAMQILMLRGTVIEERQAMVRNLVDSAVKVLSYYDAAAASGKMSADEARQQAFAAIGAMRWGPYNDYLGVYGTGPSDAGVTYVHAKREYINVNRWNYQDANKKYLIQDIVRAARAGGGFVEYQVPRASGGPELPKMSYVGAYGSGDKMLAIQAGVYVDDIDAAVYQRALWAGLGALAGLLIAAITAFWLGRSVVVPLDQTCAVMDELTKGHLGFEVPFTDRRNEIGRMARSLQILKDHLAESERIRAEQELAKQQAAEERRAVLARIADEFERSIGGVIQTTTSAAGELQTSAQSMSSIVSGTSDQSAKVAAAAEQTAKNVQTVSASAEQLSSSIQEIAKQVTQSSSIAQNAVEQATRTESMVTRLVHASQKIGEVMALIQTIAGQTNLLALNATIESARAGEAGKGFAVVANEVKALSAQTAKATEEITSQIEAIRDATTSTVTAIREIGTTIGQMNEITETIAAAVEEQGVATKEIARSVQQAAQGTQGVMQHIVGVREASGQVGAAAAQVLSAAAQLGSQSDQLKSQTGRFLGNVRAA